MAEDKNAGGRPSKKASIDDAIADLMDRPDLRAEPRPDDPRERARKRADEIMGHIGDLDQGTDEFYLPPGYVPDGWVYEWKRWSVLGQEDPNYQTSLRRMGWDYVPASRHNDMVALGTASDAFIFRKGMVLMERPEEVQEAVKKLDAKRARDQVRIKESQLTSPNNASEFERNNKGDPLVKVKKNWGPVVIPD